MKEVFKIVAKKRIIGMLVMSGLFLLMIGTVFAAYTFQRLLTDNKADIGTLTVTNKKFVDYSSDNENEKLRVDTVAVVEGITLNYTTSYNITNDNLFINGKTYYSDQNGTIIEDAEVGAKISEYGSSVYEQVRTYTSIASIGNAYDGSDNSLNCTVGTTNVITIPTSPSFNVTCTIDGSNGVIASATSNNTNHKVTISANGLGFVVLDKTLTDATEATVSAETAITCSATSKKSSPDNIYLNQLGFEFTFTVEIPVYVRIHIQDAWKRTRVYSAITRENYVLKDQISGVSPFTVVDDNWYFDESTNYVYLKNMYIPTQDEEGNYNPATFRFDVNEAYYYTSLLTSIYTEYIDVEVSFTVDIVQANRADVLWGIDPSTIGA